MNAITIRDFEPKVVHAFDWIEIEGTITCREGDAAILSSFGITAFSRAPTGIRVMVRGDVSAGYHVLQVCCVRWHNALFYPELCQDAPAPLLVLENELLVAGTATGVRTFSRGEASAWELDPEPVPRIAGTRVVSQRLGSYLALDPESSELRQFDRRLVGNEPPFVPVMDAHGASTLVTDGLSAFLGTDGPDGLMRLVYDSFAYIDHLEPVGIALGRHALACEKRPDALQTTLWVLAVDERALRSYDFSTSMASSAATAGEHLLALNSGSMHAAIAGPDGSDHSRVTSFGSGPPVQPEDSVITLGGPAIGLVLTSGRTEQWDPRDRIYVLDGPGNLEGFALGTDGVLTPLPAFPVNVGKGARSLDRDLTGARLFIGRADGFAEYAVDLATGSVKEEPASPVMLEGGAWQVLARQHYASP